MQTNNQENSKFMLSGISDSWLLPWLYLPFQMCELLLAFILLSSVLRFIFIIVFDKCIKSKFGQHFIYWTP